MIAEAWGSSESRRHSLEWLITGTSSATPQGWRRKTSNGEVGSCHDDGRHDLDGAGADQETALLQITASEEAESRSANLDSRPDPQNASCQQ